MIMNLTQIFVFLQKSYRYFIRLKRIEEIKFSPNQIELLMLLSEKSFEKSCEHNIIKVHL